MDSVDIRITADAGETKEIAEKIASECVRDIGKDRARCRIFCLYGEMGTGKTTFVQGFAKGLGILKRVISPTFTIVRSYRIPETGIWFHHADLYRLNSTEGVAETGIGEILTDTDDIVCIEWADRMGTRIPRVRRDIRFELLPDGTHRIECREYQNG
jgi:tRNA threonylcarbamoyladenosine biosynthesis protein TsaE